MVNRWRVRSNHGCYTLKALVRYKFGPPDVLRLEEIEKPTAGDDELLIRVHAVSLNLGEWELLTGHPVFISVLATLFGPKPRVDPESPDDDSAYGPLANLRKPKYKILGTDIAGRVEAVGTSVTQFQPGDDVFGMCGFGALAEYVCVPENAPLAPKPARMTFEQAAAFPQAGFIALQALRNRNQLRPRSKVLINGAGGGAGTLAVQLAKSLGAEVTGVDNFMKQDMMRSIGADHVIDYAKDDFIQREQRYDLILDLAAYRSLFECMNVLTPNGIYLLAGGGGFSTLQAALLGPVISVIGSKKAVFLLAESNKADLLRMTELHETGTVVPVVDRTFPLSDAAEAFRLVGGGRSLGKVVITM